MHDAVMCMLITWPYEERYTGDGKCDADGSFCKGNGGADQRWWVLTHYN